jgi:hypothetical protein
LCQKFKKYFKTSKSSHLHRYSSLPDHVVVVVAAAAVVVKATIKQCKQGIPGITGYK